jgi:hypothetical protein
MVKENDYISLSLSFSMVCMRFRLRLEAVKVDVGGIFVIFGLFQLFDIFPSTFYWKSSLSGKKLFSIYRTVKTVKSSNFFIFTRQNYMNTSFAEPGLPLHN